MKMNSLLAAALFLCLVAAPIRAQNDPAETETKDAAAANAKGNVTITHHDDDATVRIDHTGVHIGGDNPVDIGVPDASGRHGALRSVVHGVVLPIIAVLGAFGLPVAIVGLVLYFNHRRNRMLHETLRAMVEKGVPIPPELLSTRAGNGPDVARRRRNDIRAGLVLTGVGCGLLVVAGKVGFITMFIGVALLISGIIANQNRDNQAPQ